MSQDQRTISYNTLPVLCAIMKTTPIVDFRQERGKYVTGVPNT